MSWARFSDSFYRNDKQLAMSDAAFRVYVCGICYAMQEAELTGFLSNAQLLGLVRYLRKKAPVRIELVSIKAWEEVADGILIHDFELYIEPSSRERTKAWRDRKRAERDVLVTSHVVTGDTAGDVTVTALARDESPVPVPVPVPVFKDPPVIPLSTDWVQICQAWETMAGHQLSAKEKEDVHRALAEDHRLTAADMIGHLNDFIEWWEGQHIDRRPEFKNALSWLKDKNNQAADAGRRPAERGFVKAFPA